MLRSAPSKVTEKLQQVEIKEPYKKIKEKKTYRLEDLLENKYPDILKLWAVIQKPKYRSGSVINIGKSLLRCQVFTISFQNEL